jgi:hypothetical protein
MEGEPFDSLRSLMAGHSTGSARSARSPQVAALAHGRPFDWFDSLRSLLAALPVIDEEGRKHFLGSDAKGDKHGHGKGIPDKSEFPADRSDGKTLDVISEKPLIRI